MRISAQEKDATRRRILDAALDLFRTRGFDSTTTRDIAAAADIASGTLFNYFAAKEAIVAALAEEALRRARPDAATAAAGDVKPPPVPAHATLEEDLFALVAAELRQLRPLRKFLRPALETTLGPLAAGNSRPGPGDRLRIAHLEAVAARIRHHGLADPSPVALHVYWSLYAGVLAFWAADASPKQEDTLAVLDESLAMFIAWLRSDRSDRPDRPAAATP